MSAFSTSAQRAMGQLRGQIIEGQKSKFAVVEEATKVAELSKRLEWAKLVHEMSDSSKVVVLKAPRQLQEYEQSSPKLFMQIVLGIVFGVIAALIAVIVKEITDKKLSYSMLGDDVIYNLRKDFVNLKRTILTNQNKQIALVTFEQISPTALEKLQTITTSSIIQADISNEFVNAIDSFSDIIVIASINKTDAELYKQVKQMLKDMNKSVLKEVLI